MFLINIKICRSVLKSYCRFIHFDNKNKLLRMNHAYFKRFENDDKIHITFRYVNKDLNSDRVYNFSRDINENVDVCLNRIKANLEKELNKKVKKKNKKVAEISEQSQSQNEISVELFNAEEKIENVPFTNLLPTLESDKSYLQLVLLGEKFPIAFNTPWINSITLPTSIMSGFFVYPNKLELEFANKDDSEFIWYKGKVQYNENNEKVEWERIGIGFAYLICPEDVGYRIRLQCTPKKGLLCGPTVEAISINDVQAGPGICPFETRHLYTTRKLSGKDFRVVTYNLLADYYCDSDYSRTVLFGFCPAYALKIDYRKQLFIKELVGYNGDIICLQEVDGKIFDHELVPLLGNQNMLGIHNKKGTTPEGLATFYRSDRFKCISNYAINIGENISSLPVFRDLYEKIADNEKLMNRIVNRSTTLQIAFLESLEHPGKYLAVANTHLYFHPDADHIRLLQIGFAIKFIEHVVSKFKDSNPTSEVGLIFCGDFNSSPDCGMYKLFTENYVPDNIKDWSSNPDEAVQNISLTQPFKLKSACGILPYTNYIPGFKECIDYIFFETDILNVQRFIDIPSEEELSTYRAIPSVVSPSDHIALVADLQWNS